MQQNTLAAKGNVYRKIPAHIFVENVICVQVLSYVDYSLHLLCHVEICNTIPCEASLICH
jgi:hypothetical protein